MREKARQFSKRFLPAAVYRKIVHMTRRPPVGRIDFGNLRKVEPVSRVWGLDRGKPVDRYYIESFLQAHAHLIRGHVLEVGENTYTLQFGGKQVVKSDVLHVSPEYPNATVIADLTDAEHVASDQFDCMICTQTLHLIYDVQSAIGTLHRILKPGGVLLATLPGISQISRYDMDRWGDYWRFTSASARRLFASSFGDDALELAVYGNVLAAIAFLHGLASEELNPQELDYRDPDYEVTLAILAKKTGK